MSNISDRDSNAKSAGMAHHGTVFPPWTHRSGHYGLALLLVAAAAMLRWMLPGALGPTPFVVFYLACFGAAALGGLGPGLLAVLASWLCVEWFFDSVPNLSAFYHATSPGRLAIFLAGGLAVSLVAEAIRRGRIRARRQMRELADLTQALREARDGTEAANAQLQTQAHELRTVNADLREREQALRESEDRLHLALAEAEEGRDILEAMMEHVPLGIVIADAADMKIRMVSRFGRELAGELSQETREEFTGIPAEEHLQRWEIYRADGVTPATLAELPLARAIRHGEWVKEEEWVVARKGGVRVPVLCTAAPICDREGHVTGGVLGCQDMTRRKQAEAQLRQLNEELEQRVQQRTAELLYRTRQLQKLTLDMSEAEDRERRRIAEILHDDLQQVLAAARFHVNLMRRQVRQDSSLQASAAAIDEMLKDAINKSRSLSHELNPAVLQYGDLGETLRWLADRVQAKYGLIVHVHVPEGVQVSSDAVTMLLYKTAQELLFNVVKHGHVNKAKVRVRKCPRCICLSISDRGRGFDPQELCKTSGFGLLSIRERVEMLGGRMRIKSTKGKGSTFLLAVPDGEPAGVVSPELLHSGRPDREPDP